MRPNCTGSKVLTFPATNHLKPSVHPGVVKEPPNQNVSHLTLRDVIDLALTVSPVITQILLIENVLKSYINSNLLGLRGIDAWKLLALIVDLREYLRPKGTLITIIETHTDDCGGAYSVGEDEVNFGAEVFAAEGVL